MESESMKRKDKTTNTYLGDAERLADLINGYVYHGKTLFKKENLRERKQVYTVGDDKLKWWGIIRDIVMEAELDAVLILIAVESQSSIHYAMPVRVMQDDLANYVEQWKKLETEPKKKKDLRHGEFLSGLSISDKLIPMITICVYWGEEPWNGPMRLKDMLDLEGIPEEIQGLIADYPVNLIDVNNFEHTEYFKTDLRVVFDFLKNRGDRKAMKSYIKEHAEELSNLAEDAYDVISEMANVKELKDIKETNKNMEGGCDMCKAFEEWAEEERKEGRKEGWDIAKKVLRMEKEGKKYHEIAEHCEISLDDVQEILEIFAA